MSQSTRRWVAHKVEELRKAPELPFRDLLDTDDVAPVLEKYKDDDARDRIYTPEVTLWTFLSQILDGDKACRKAVARLIASRIAGGLKPCSSETGSYCKARKRLPQAAVTELVRDSARRLDARAPEDWTWNGRHVVLVDGTTVSMPDTPANQATFPQARTQKPGVGFPIARLVALIALITGAVRDLAMGPYAGKETGEPALFRALWGRLQAGEIVLGDRCFASYFGIAPLAERGVDGLFRMHQKRKFDFGLGQVLGIEDHVVSWVKPARPEWMDEATYAQLPAELRVRELRVKVSRPGFRVDELVLVTTLLDPIDDPKEAVASLFYDRWNIELDLRSIKCTLKMDVLRCETPEMVEKEVWMHALAYNLIRTLMGHASEAHDRRPRGLSFKGALQALGAFRESLQWTAGVVRAALWEGLLSVIACHEVGTRPGRAEPRAVKRRPKPHKLLNEPRKEAREHLFDNKKCEQIDPKNCHKILLGNSLD